MINFIDVNTTGKDKIVLNKPGEYLAFMHNLSRQVTFDIRSPEVNLEVYGIYIGRGTDNFSLESTQLHTSPGSESNLYIKGVFFDESKFLYKGLIRIEKTAAGSKAYQKNQNLKMSGKAFVESDPFLEILNNDVSCGHGSSTGKLNEEDIYYLMSRGITRQKAEDLLIEGFIGDVVETIQKRIPDFSFSPAN